MPTTGPTLRRERRAAEVRATDLAKAMLISRATLYTIEQAAAPDPKYVASHRAAVKALHDAKDAAA